MLHVKCRIVLSLLDRVDKSIRYKIVLSLLDRLDRGSFSNCKGG
jgi:hypothetical protein